MLDLYFRRAHWIVIAFHLSWPLFKNPKKGDKRGGINVFLWNDRRRPDYPGNYIGMDLQISEVFLHEKSRIHTSHRN